MSPAALSGSPHVIYAPAHAAADLRQQGRGLPQRLLDACPVRLTPPGLHRAKFKRGSPGWPYRDQQASGIGTVWHHETFRNGSSKLHREMTINFPK